jgi:subtilisin family serine protease
MKKRGQITFFILFGITVILIVSLLIGYKITSVETKLDPSLYQEDIAEFELAYNSFYLYADSCIKDLTKKAIENIGTKEEIIAQYMKISAIECFDESLFKNVDINVSPFLSVKVEEASLEYNIEVLLKVIISRETLKKRIDSFSFVISKTNLNIKGGEGSVSLDGKEFVFDIPGERGDDYQMGEVIVHYNQEPEEGYNDLLKSLNVVERSTVYDANILDLLGDEMKDVINSILLDEKLLFDESKISFSKLSASLLDLDFVEDVTRNKNSFSDRRIEFFNPQRGDEFFNYQWYLENKGQFFGIPGADINIKEAWKITEGNEDVIIAVIDQGVFRNKDIMRNIDYDKNYDLVDNDHDTNPSSSDETHGTHVIGTIVSEKDNRMGISGVCPSCKVINIRVMDSQSGADTKRLVNAILLSVSNGAKIVSMSLGGTYYSSYEEKIFDLLLEKGVVFVAAAGNDGVNEKNYPAAYNSVISVAATNNLDELAYFSNFGDWVDLAAPGELIFSSCDSKSYCFSSGTSMATPIVSGVIGLMMSVDNNLSPNDIKGILKSSSDIVNGVKRINAGRALEYIE